MTSQNMGYVWGSLGVLGFSLTLPATRAAVTDIDPLFVGLGRAMVAAVLAALLLSLTHQPRPSRSYLTQLMVVAFGVVIGFPLLSTIAMQTAPASHGAVVTGLLPLVTALCGVWRAKERPPRKFWFFALIGSVLVVAFSLFSGSKSLHVADLFLLGAVFAAAIGYAEGAILARTMGAWQVICWALVYAAPIIAIFLIFYRVPLPLHISTSAYLGFFYVSFVSMFLAFFAWYLGLAMGGIARVGQVQLLQPFLTIFASAALLGEKIGIETILFALGVGLCVFGGKSVTRNKKVLSYDK